MGGEDRSQQWGKLGLGKPRDKDRDRALLCSVPPHPVVTPPWGAQAKVATAGMVGSKHRVVPILGVPHTHCSTSGPSRC